MNLFKERFTQLLEAPLAPPADVSVPSPEEAMSDVDALGSTLDSGTDAKDFDVEAPAPGQALATPEDALRQQNAQMMEKLQAWIGRMEDFASYLNGLEPSSIQSQLNDAACDTLFDKIASSETKKISRVAQDLRSVVEALKAYMLASGK
mgnify:CR=1 FL=1